VVDLVVLGLLLDGPMNPYGLGKVVDERQLGRLVKISKPAVYKSCRRLSEAGHLSGKAVRDTEAPEKVVYSLTRSGRRHFDDLMSHYSSSLHAFHFEFNSVIWHLSLVTHAEGLRMLKALTAELVRMQSWLVAHEKEVEGAGFGARVVVKQYRMVVTTLVQWARETTEEFTRRPGGSNV
jgi:DNA-binding PadR family transcriptional regulator